MEEPGDLHYHSMCHRLVRRAVWLGAVTMAVAMVLLYGSSGAAAPFYRETIGPVTASGTPCTARDLALPALDAMPAPGVLAATQIVRSVPGIEQLTPPRGTPEVTAAQAWQAMIRAGWAAPSRAGSARVVLGDLWTTLLRPDGSHAPVAGRLVWAIEATHQPERPTAVSPAGAPACYFESTVLYVDALTGRCLVGEVFPTPESGRIT